MSDTKLRLIVAVCATLLFVVAGLISPPAATNLSFPLLFAVIVAPRVREAYQEADKGIIIFSVALIALGLIGAFFTTFSMVPLALGLGLPNTIKFFEWMVGRMLSKRQMVTAKVQAAVIKDPNRRRTFNQRREDAKRAREEAKINK